MERVSGTLFLGEKPVKRVPDTPSSAASVFPIGKHLPSPIQLVSATPPEQTGIAKTTMKPEAAAQAGVVPKTSAPTQPALGNSGPVFPTLFRQNLN